MSSFQEVLASIQMSSDKADADLMLYAQRNPRCWVHWAVGRRNAVLVRLRW